MRFNTIATGDAVTQALVNKIMTYSPLLANHIEFFKKGGEASKERKEQGKLEAGTRSLDKPYTEEVVKPEWFFTGKKIIGKTVRLDVAREVLGTDIPSEMMYQILRTAPGIAFTFNNMFINGDGGDRSEKTEQFDGLKKLVSASQIVKPSANGLQMKFGSMTDKTAQQEFLIALDLAIAKCIGVNKVIVANGVMLAQINTIAREYITMQKSEFGVPISYYNMIPMVNIEQAGDSIMPFDEQCGTQKKCSSIYVVSLEEGSGFSFVTPPADGFKVYPMQKVGNFYEHMIDFICDSALFREKAISKLEGLYVDTTE